MEPKAAAKGQLLQELVAWDGRKIWRGEAMKIALRSDPDQLFALISWGPRVDLRTRLWNL